MGSSYFDPRIAQRGVGSAWDDIIFSAAAASGVPASLIKGVISAESAWRPNAVSRGGSSFGLMQLNVTAQAITQAQAFDPAFAIPFGARVLAGQLAKRSSLELALAGYNAGTSRSDPDLANRLAGDVNGVASYVQPVLDFNACCRCIGAVVAKEVAEVLQILSLCLSLRLGVLELRLRRRWMVRGSKPVVGTGRKHTN